MNTLTITKNFFDVSDFASTLCGMVVTFSGRDIKTVTGVLVATTSCGVRGCVRATLNVCSNGVELRSLTGEVLAASN